MPAVETSIADFEFRRPRVLLLDGQNAVREMTAMVLDREGFAPVAESASGLEGIELFRRHQPDLVVLGLALLEMAGPETILALHAEKTRARLLVFTGTHNRALLEPAIEARPHGFVHKTEPLETFRQALAAVVRGHSFLSPFATAVTEGLRTTVRTDKKLNSKQQLNSKQRTILKMIAEGRSTREMAEKLELSPKTIEHYRKQLMEKLGHHDVASLTRYAVRCGLVN